MTTLANFPLVSQLTTVTGDGRPSENAQFDCVPACIDAACRWLLNKPENSVFDPDNFKDQAYGEALRNSGTAAFKYVDFCKSLGIHLYAVENADYARAVEAAHKYVQANKPVIFTRDDPYVDQSVHPDWTHVCCFFGEDGSGLTALDPYIGKAVYKTDAGWINILRNSELWLAERIQPVATLPPGWHDDGTTLSTPSGELVLGFRAHVLPLLLAGKWNPANQPLGKQYYTKQLEASNPLLGDGDQIILTEGMLGYPHNPQAPYEGMKNKVIEEYVGTELDFTRKQVAKYYNLAASAQAQVAQLQAQIAQLQQSNPDALAAIHQAQAILAPFK